MFHLEKPPFETCLFFAGFLLLIGMHYFMAWKVNQQLPMSDRIEVRGDNYLQVYRAYRKTSGNEVVTLVLGVGIVLTTAGIGSMTLEVLTGATLPALNVPPPNSTNPSQLGEVR